MSQDGDGVLARLPFDCWSVVLSYFTDRSDFLSVILVIKGLYEHVNAVTPKSCRFIIFRMKSLPMNSRLRHVSNILCDSSVIKIQDEEAEGDESSLLSLSFSKYMGCENLQSFCDKFFRYFSQAVNVIMKFNFITEILALECPESHIITRIEFEELSCGTLAIESKFPNLRELVLSNKTKIPLHDFTPSSTRYNLKVNWSDFPSLRNVDLQNWVMKKPFRSHSFEIISLKEVLSCLECTLDFDMENLEKLSLFDSSISRAVTLEKTEALKHLIIVYKGVCGVRQSIDFHISNLPHLVTLEIGDDSTPSFFSFETNLEHFRSNEETMELKNLPKLRSLKLRNIRFPIRFECGKESDSLDIQFFDVAEVDLFDIESGMKIRKFDFYTGLGAIGDNLDISKLRNLEYVSFEIRPFGSYISKSFVDFSVLRTLHIDNSNIFCEKVENCPKLKSMKIVPVQNFVTNNVPELEFVRLYFNYNLQASSDLENIINQFSECKNLRKLEVHKTSHNLNFENIDERVRNNIEELSVGLMREVSFDGCFKTKLRKMVICERISRKLEIVNHKNLEEVSFRRLSNLSFILRNCESIRRLVIENFELSESKNNRIDLQNLPSLEHLKLCQSELLNFSWFTLVDVSVRTLEIVLHPFTGDNYEESLREHVRKNVVSSDRFPLLETIVLHCKRPDFLEAKWMYPLPSYRNIQNIGKEMGQNSVNSEFMEASEKNDVRKYLGIGMLKGLKRLKKIEIHGSSEEYLQEPIIGSFEDIDLDFVIIEVYIEEKENEIHVMNLKEYCTKMKVM